MVSLITFILLCVMAVPTTLFPILYWLLADWRQTREGQAVMVSAIGLGLLVDISLANHFIRVDNVAVALIVDLVVFTLIIAGSTLQVVLLIRAQRRGRKKEAS